MLNPRLSEFTEQQLGLMLSALVNQREHQEEHVRALSQNEIFAKIFKTKIKAYNKEIEASREAETQIAYQVMQKIRESQITSN